MSDYKCPKCKWFTARRQLTRDEMEYIRLKKKFEGALVTINTRMCCLGGCKDNERFEEND